MDNHVPSDIADAVLTQLRNSPCAGLFGDTWAQAQSSPGVMKFATDFAGDAPAPWLVTEEIGETYQWMTASAGGVKPYIATGRMAVHIFAPGRSQARQLGIAVAEVLDDPPLAWPGFPNLMNFRLAMAAFVPVTETAPGSPTIFHRVLTFEFAYSGFLGNFS